MPRGTPELLNGPKLCSECRISPHKYKCPQCRTPYCSTTCFKSHRQDCSPTAAITVETDNHFGSKNGKKLSNKRAYPCNFPTEDTISTDTLLKIKDDERIKSLMGSGQLRSLITKLNETNSPQWTFKSLMENPEFRAFSNVVLDIAGVMDLYETEEC